MPKKATLDEVASKPTVVQMSHVSFFNGNRYILRDINWEVRAGQHWAIGGLNGSGKTTLLSMVSGYVWPSHGEVSVLGKRFGSYDIRELRKKIGWVSSSLQEKFYGDETAEEIVLSGRFATIGLYDKPRRTDVERAHLLLKRLDSGHTAGQPYATLSQGEKQKVLIARGLISCPRVLILDEPCAGLDIVSREHLLSLIGDIGARESTPTLLYVTHRFDEILPVFEHALLLRDGAIHSQGKTVDVLTRKNLSDLLGMAVDVRRRKGRVWVRV